MLTPGLLVVKAPPKLPWSEGGAGERGLVLKEKGINSGQTQPTDYWVEPYKIVNIQIYFT